jgi:protein-histidine pros-kinase
VSEAEKQRLARELHDDMGASLTAAKMDASWIAGRLAESADETLMSRSKRLIGSLDQAITLKRRLTTDLLPPLLAQLGLFEALRSLGEDLASHSETEVSIEIPETQPELDHPTSLALFRIAQEAFTNIRKYAQARHVSLKVTVTDERVFMEITDDGRGFDPAQVGEECFGLDSMRHRARMISANVGVRSAPGQGTAISVDYTLPGHRR